MIAFADVMVLQGDSTSHPDSQYAEQDLRMSVTAQTQKHPVNVLFRYLRTLRPTHCTWCFQKYVYPPSFKSFTTGSGCSGFRLLALSGILSGMVSQMLQK